MRFIPARAGNSSDKDAKIIFNGVHPRSCGEQLSIHCLREKDIGSSPLVRGTGCASACVTGCQRFIPARAGNSLVLNGTTQSSTVHPRSCGEQ